MSARFPTSIIPSVRPSVHAPSRLFLTPSVYQSISPSISPSDHPSIAYSSNSSKITGIFNHATLPVLYEGASSGQWSLSGKNRRLSSIFDSCWRNEVSNFRLRQFAKVGPFCEHYEPDVDINTENSLDNSGSNETMQKVLASIVLLWRMFF